MVYGEPVKSIITFCASCFCFVSESRPFQTLYTRPLLFALHVLKLLRKFFRWLHVFSALSWTRWPTYFHILFRCHTQQTRRTNWLMPMSQLKSVRKHNGFRMFLFFSLPQKKPRSIKTQWTIEMKQCLPNDVSTGSLSQAVVNLRCKLVAMTFVLSCIQQLRTTNHTHNSIHPCFLASIILFAYYQKYVTNCVFQILCVDCNRSRSIKTRLEI